MNHVFYGGPQDYPQLTLNFGFKELTVTNNTALQERNRIEAMDFLPSLKALAMMLELVRQEVGPIKINSGFRCPELNGATPGSSLKSQHMKGEACDMVGAKMELTADNVDAFFEAVLKALIEKAIPFGQLIKEEAKRDYGVVRWVHLSLGVPFRPKDKCGQVLFMHDGVYDFVKQISLEG